MISEPRPYGALLKSQEGSHREWPETSVHTKKELLARLALIEKSIPRMDCRVLPSSFEAEDPTLAALPRPLDWQSESLADALKEFPAKRGVMMRLPLFWQVESFLHAACRIVGIPLFVNELENMPVGAAALRGRGVDVVLTENADANAFSLYRQEKGVSASSWFIIHRIEEPWQLSPALEGARVAQEVHLFPGLPLLIQCAALWGTDRFHLSAEFEIHSKNDDTSISSVKNALVPLREYHVPLLKKVGLCTCGRE